MKDDGSIQKAPNVEAQDEKYDPATPAISKWYWVKNDEDDIERGQPEKWLGCVTHVGSNYVMLEGPSERHRDSSQYDRVHFDVFWDKCEYEPDASSVIQRKIGERQVEFNRLMGRIKAITARLGVVPSPELTEGAHTQALATRTGEPIPQYREALVKAKDKDLPELFDKMKHESEMMATWMKADVFSLEGQQGLLRGSLDKIGRRILAVDLYAGLSEEAEQIRQGDPAVMGEPLQLIQRRCYMDEECLARYTAGGMEFKDIRAFDQWLAEKENMDRLLPFSRCMVAFRVRRNEKFRTAVNLSQFITMMNDRELDNMTFLYVRNGSQLWRINTAIDFGPKLFPDFNRQKMDSSQKLWAKNDVLITDDEYQSMVESERLAQEKSDKANAEWDALTDEERKSNRQMWPGSYVHEESRNYKPFVKESVYYDDIAEVVSDAMEAHNRIATIIQGILDRSPMLNPHPPWKVWTNDDFNAALRLIYDEDRALVAGEKPDFEAYRERLNKTIGTGSVTVGQQSAWRIEDSKKENNLWGNPGPGIIAIVQKFHPRKRACSYTWNRRRQTYARYYGDPTGPIKSHFTCPASRVFNVDAYTPGDFHQLFDDPRTRA